MPPRPAVVLFDLGDTLLVERGYDLHPGCTRLASHPRFRGDPDAASLADALAARIDRVHATNLAELTFADWLREQLAPETGAGKIAELERDLWPRIARLEPQPGVHEALAAVEADGVGMAVVSNAIFASQTLHEEVARHGLDGSLAFVLSSAELGVRKPDPAIFREALRRLGAAPEAAWFVGDSWANDVAGAAAAGLHPIWLAHGEAPAPQSVRHERVPDWPAFARLWQASR